MGRARFAQNAKVITIYTMATGTRASDMESVRKSHPRENITESG